MSHSQNLTHILTPGYTFKEKRTVATIEPVDLAKLVAPTGRIIGCDPLMSPNDAEPYTVTVDPGVYRMIAWVAVFSKRGVEEQRRNAALELRVSEEPTTGWEMALQEDNSIEDLEDGEFFGYGVDTGCGTLADETALRSLGQWEYDRVEENFIPKVYPEAPVPGYTPATTDEATGANVLPVGSGWGDGAYPTFIGRDAAGAVTRFVTDFFLFPED